MMETESRELILREEDFTALLAEVSKTFGGWVLYLRDHPQGFEVPADVAQLVQSAHALEVFIDDFGGRHNRTFVTVGELVASTRGLAVIKSAALHLTHRLSSHQTGMETAELEGDLARANTFLSDSLSELFKALCNEAQTLGLSWTMANVHSSSGEAQRRQLPRNLDIEESVREEQHIAEIAGRFMQILEASRNLKLRHIRPAEELPEYVADFATEERCRWYESGVHNIQSMYDTYVLRTTLERQHPWLLTLRGHASVALYLLEMSTELVHFYQRHENDIRHEPTAEAIAGAVSKDGVLDLAVNVCLRQAYLFVEGAADVTSRILETFVSTDRTRLEMPEGITLHARPLALVVQIARHYGTPLEITLNGESCSGNSLMSLIMLGGKHPRPEFVEVRGDSRVVHDLTLLFAARLGEDGQELPEQLGYLRVQK